MCRVYAGSVGAKEALWTAMGNTLRLALLLLGWSYHSARGEGVSLPPFLSDIVADMISLEHISPQDVVGLRDKVCCLR
jgi:hypothetical protein